MSQSCGMKGMWAVKHRQAWIDFEGRIYRHRKGKCEQRKVVVCFQPWLLLHKHYMCVYIHACVDPSVCMCLYMCTWVYMMLLQVQSEISLIDSCSQYLTSSWWGCFRVWRKISGGQKLAFELVSCSLLQHSLSSSWSTMMLYFLLHAPPRWVELLMMMHWNPNQSLFP